MKTISNKANQTSNKRAFAIVVLMVLSGMGMFGQQTKNEIAAPAVINSVEVASANANEAQMELVSWFMGSKQSQLSIGAQASGTISTNNTGKKQFINNGLTPNRILSRTFMKKAINHDSTIA